MNDLFSPGMQRVADVAARKGVTLDFRLVPASTLSDEEMAVAVGAELGQLVKCVVCVAPRPGGRVSPIVCLVSSRNRLDFALLAAITREAGIRGTTPQEARSLFGYPVRDVPPFGHGRDVRTVMDESLGRYPWLWVAAGEESTMLRVAPGTLRMLSDAVVAAVAQPSWMRPVGVRSIGSAPFRSRIRQAERSRRPRAREGV